MGFLRALLTCTLLVLGICLLWTYNPTLRGIIQSYVENGEFLTLEARFSADQIMEGHHEELLPDEQYSFQEPTLKFYPYLLMEVKYTEPNGRTRESAILWSMVNGEMVLDTDTWEKTHGFEDAINANASRSDFLLMNALAKYRGALPLSRLQMELNVDQGELEQMLENAQRKYLIIVKGSEVGLHFQNPHFNVPPQTRINQWLVTKPYTTAQRVAKKYSRRQIVKVANAAFGYDFTVRNLKEVYVPVLCIEVLNPDGSVLTSYWNALNGQRVDTKFLSFAP